MNYGMEIAGSDIPGYRTTRVERREEPALLFLVAVVAARWLQPLLFQQSARDPVVYALVGGIIALVTVVASASPAIRATRADPNTALRSD